MTKTQELVCLLGLVMLEEAFLRFVRKHDVSNHDVPWFRLRPTLRRSRCPSHRAGKSTAPEKPEPEMTCGARERQDLRFPSSCSDLVIELSYQEHRKKIQRDALSGTCMHLGTVTASLLGNVYKHI